MNVERFESNSHKSKEEKTVNQVEERKKLDKVVSGSVKTKKKSEISKFFHDFVTEDLPKVKTFVIRDVIVPSIKKAIVETIDMILYGDSRGGRGRTNSSKISYRSYYDEPRPRDRSVETRTGYSYDDVVLETRGDAEHVLSQMDDLISEYGVVSVADLYDLVGISGNYTDNKYGWTNVRNAEVRRTRDGFILDMPKALPIK